MNAFVPAALEAVYFDGVVAAEHAVHLQVVGAELIITGEGVRRVVTLKQVRWPEHTRHGPRIVHLAGGGSVHARDNRLWDAWCDANGITQGSIARIEGSWRWVAGIVLVLAAVAVALQWWGIPVLARGLLVAIPQSVDSAIGQVALEAIDKQWMKPSKLSFREQERLLVAFSKVAGALPPDRCPPWQLVFRQSGIGPNALALPGGTIILTDELVALLPGEEDVVMGVLSHELGHLQRRHGMRLLVQAAVLGSLAALVLGDFSTMLAGVPVLLGHAAYSRQTEQEADAEAVHTLQAAGIAPRVMLSFFEKLPAARAAAGADAPGREASWLGIAFATHPADAERIRFFANAARD